MAEPIEWIAIGEGALLALGDLEELLEDGVGRVAAVGEIKVVVIEAGVEKLLPVVDLVVEADDARHVVLLKVLESVCVSFSRSSPA